MKPLKLIQPDDDSDNTSNKLIGPPKNTNDQDHTKIQGITTTFKILISFRCINHSILTNMKQTSHTYVPIKMMSQIQIVDWLTVCTAKVEKKKKEK